MNRREFMERLEELLKDIPVEERAEALSYYAGYFEDAGWENEERVIRELESPEKVARNIKADLFGESQPHWEPKETKKNHPTTEMILFIIIIILTSPFWIGAVGMIFGFLAGVTGATIGLFGGTIAVFSAAFAAGVTGATAEAVLLMGAGFLILAISVLLLIFCVWLWGRGIPCALHWLINLCKSVFRKREGA